MIVVVTVLIDNLISLAVKEQWNSEGKNCLAITVASVIQAILRNNKKYRAYIIFIRGKIFI